MPDPSTCDHREIYGGMCTTCLAPVDVKTMDVVANLGGGQTSRELFVRREHAESFSAINRVQLTKKHQLALIVDLDKTVIHTTVDPMAGQWLRNGVDGIKAFEVANPQGHRMQYFTRLRPGVFPMLERLKNMYELHIFTMGTRKYAMDILRFLDPTGQYFSTRVLTKDESLDSMTKSKNLEGLFPNGEDMVVIIDDCPPVWHFRPNLLPIVPYNFFISAEEVNVNTVDPRAQADAQQGRSAKDRMKIASKRSTLVETVTVPDTLVSAIAAVLPGPLSGAILTALQSELRYLYEWQSDTIVAQLRDTLKAAGVAVDESTLSAFVTANTTAWDCAKPSSDSVTAERMPLLLDELRSSVDLIDAICQDFDVTFELSTIDDAPPAPPSAVAAAAASASAHKPVPQSTCLNMSGALKVGRDLSAERVALLRFLARQVKVLQGFDIDEGKLSASLGAWIGGFVAKKSVSDLTEAVRSRIKCRELPEAVLYLRAARQLAPQASWGENGGDVSVLQAILSKASVCRRTPYLRPPVDDDVTLITVKNILVDLHHRYYHSGIPQAELSTAAVMEDLKERYKTYDPFVLHDVVILFTGVIPQGVSPDRVKIVQMAQYLGATIVSEMSYHVTHVVTPKSGTSKAEEALKFPGTYFVAPAWIEACVSAHVRVPEGDFRVPNLPSCVRGATPPPAEAQEAMEEVEIDVDVDAREARARQTAWLAEELANELSSVSSSDSEEGPQITEPDWTSAHDREEHAGAQPSHEADDDAALAQEIKAQGAKAAADVAKRANEERARRAIEALSEFKVPKAGPPRPFAAKRKAHREEEEEEEPDAYDETEERSPSRKKEKKQHTNQEQSSESGSESGSEEGSSQSSDGEFDLSAFQNATEAYFNEKENDD